MGYLLIEIIFPKYFTALNEYKFLHGGVVTSTHLFLWWCLYKMKKLFIPLIVVLFFILVESTFFRRLKYTLTWPNNCLWPGIVLHSLTFIFRGLPWTFLYPSKVPTFFLLLPVIRTISWMHDHSPAKEVWK